MHACLLRAWEDKRIQNSLEQEPVQKFPQDWSGAISPAFRRSNCRRSCPFFESLIAHKEVCHGSPQELGSHGRNCDPGFSSDVRTRQVPTVFHPNECVEQRGLFIHSTTRRGSGWEHLCGLGG